jgi:hypothetical protein
MLKISKALSLFQVVTQKAVIPSKLENFGLFTKTKDNCIISVFDSKIASKFVFYCF